MTATVDVVQREPVDTPRPEPGGATPVRRMAIAAFALIGVFVSAYLLLYKIGGLATLACGADGGCVTVQASEYAMFLGVPVAAWGLVGYLAILALALAGIQPRWLEARAVSIGLLALTGVALVFSLYLTYLEAYVIGAWCRWCLVSQALVALLFGLSLPELGRARGSPERRGG